MANIKFFKVASMPTSLTVGGVYFDNSDNTIKVATSATESVVYAGVKDATYNDTTKKFIITKSDNSNIELDFSNVASQSVSISAGDGLTGGGTIAANRTISHSIPSGAAVKTSGLYKITTDKFGHVTGTTAVAKSDITALGIPGSDTNTTYTFTGGENKITVTPSNGTAQDVDITVKILDNVIKSGEVVAGYLPKFKDDTGVIENGYSVQSTLSSSSSAIPTSAAVVAAIDSKIAATDAMIFKGTIGTGTGNVALPTNGYKTGWTYKVATAGTYAGIVCEIGDMVIALKDGPASGTSVINADWTVVQANIDGAVTGPSSSTDAHIAVFNGTTGTVIKDSGFTIAKSVPSSAVFTDTKVTSVSNHYTPSSTGATNATETAGSAVAAGGKVITSVQKDAAGHITGVTTGTIPAAPTLSGLGGVGSVSASGTAPLTLSYSKTGTAVSITGSIAEMTGATASDAGTKGIVPAPAAGKQTSFLRGDGTWAVPTNTNTTYTFVNGNGSFTVTPSNGSAQTVSIGKPSTAGTADKVAKKLTITLNGAATEYDGSAAKSVELDAAKINLTSNYAAATTYAAPAVDDSVETAISKLTKGVADAKSAGVTSFAGKTGAITIKAAGTNNGSVNLSVDTSKVLSAEIVGLKSAAFTESSAYATAAQGTAAANAIQSVRAANPGTYISVAAAKSGTTINLTPSVTVQAVSSATSSAKGLAEASDVKSYVDSQVSSVLVWEEFN